MQLSHCSRSVKEKKKKNPLAIRFVSEIEIN